MISGTASRPVGHLLREWRQRRRMSQLALACDANISTRHLSFVETGRSTPSREMVLALAEELDIPLRERNALLMAAGFAPLFPERPLTDPALQSARAVVDLVLRGYEPFPALAVDRHWTLVAANRAVTPFLGCADPALVQPPVNVLRLSLHPRGLARRIANLPEWHAHVVARLKRQTDLTADATLIALLREIEEYAPAAPSHPERPRTEHHAPGTEHHRSSTQHHAASRLTGHSDVAVPFQITTDEGVLSFYTTTMVFGTPIDVTLSELAIEAFFPADAATADALRASVPA